MKKIITILLSMALLFPCIVVFARSADTQSTTVRYTVSPTVVYIDYDGTRTTQKVEVGKLLKEPGHKGMTDYTFLGWRNLATGDFWNFQNPVKDNLVLMACYNQNDSEENGGKGKIQMGAGSFSVDIRIENSMSGASIGTDKRQLLEQLIQSGQITREELAQLSEGASMEVVLVIKGGDASIGGATKTQMENYAEGYTIGQYLDISLFKQMTKNGKMLKNQQLYELPQKITVNIRIPDHLLNTDPKIQRSYCVIRNHNGIIEILASTYQEDTHILSFQTDRFSDYAIAYKDVKKTDNTTEKETNPDSGKKSSQSSPQTGDQTEIVHYILLLIFAGFTVAGTMRRRFRKN